MSGKEQKQYLRDHPESDKAKEARRADKTVRTKKQSDAVKRRLKEDPDADKTIRTKKQSDKLKRDDEPDPDKTIRTKKQAEFVEKLTKTLEKKPESFLHRFVSKVGENIGKLTQKLKDLRKQHKATKKPEEKQQIVVQAKKTRSILEREHQKYYVAKNVLTTLLSDSFNNTKSKAKAKPSKGTSKGKEEDQQEQDEGETTVRTKKQSDALKQKTTVKPEPVTEERQMELDALHERLIALTPEKRRDYEDTLKERILSVQDSIKALADRGLEGKDIHTTLVTRLRDLHDRQKVFDQVKRGLADVETSTLKRLRTFRETAFLLSKETGLLWKEVSPHVNENERWVLKDSRVELRDFLLKKFKGSNLRNVHTTMGSIKFETADNELWNIFLDQLSNQWVAIRL
jgi:hypothetical protein